MFKFKKVSVHKTLYEKLTEAADRTGYSSTDEFVNHILEREVAKHGNDQDQELAEEQLRGLGYLE